MKRLITLAMFTTLLAALIVPAIPTAAQGTYTSPCDDYAPVEAPGVTLKSGSGNQVLLGSDGDDILTSSSGNDILCGFGGDDLLVGGSGNDVLDGGHGDDELRGGSGNDLLLNGETNKEGSGNDTVGITPVVGTDCALALSFHWVDNNISLEGLDLRNCDLSGAYLQFAYLGDSDLTGANLTGADLRSVNLYGANLTGANLTDVIWGSTTCPDGFGTVNDGSNTCEGHLTPAS